MTGKEGMSEENSDLLIHLVSHFYLISFFVQEFCLALYVLSHFVMHESKILQIPSPDGSWGYIEA